jgi:hypothetical protein
MIHSLWTMLVIAVVMVDGYHTSVWAVDDVREIAGKWEGRNEWGSVVILTVEGDGKFVASIMTSSGVARRNGMARIEGGELLYDADLSSGELTFRGDAKPRLLTMHGTYKPQAAALGATGNFKTDFRESR